MFDTCIIDHTIKVPAKHVGKNLMDILEVRTRSDLEGKCGPQGYIRPGSIKILNFGKGELIDIDFGKSYMFALKIKCDICNPLRGLRFKAIVQAHNKIGVLAEGGFFDNFGNLIPVMEVVVIKDTVMLQNEIPTDELEVGDEVNIEVLGRVYELHDSRIRAFGRTVKNLDERSDFTVDQSEIVSNIQKQGPGSVVDEDDDASVAGITADDADDDDPAPEDNVEEDGLSDIDEEEDDDTGAAGDDDDPVASDV